MKIIGVMTGNSLDGVDVILTEFTSNFIKDLAFYSLPFPADLTANLITLRSKLKNRNPIELKHNAFFTAVLNRYTLLVAKAINDLCQGFDKSEIVAIGFHGQTCDHFPPSIAGNQKPYTLQIADAQGLADLTDIPVVYDFRSDDIMNGGEGAPLAPIHNAHLAESLMDFSCVAFCNAGNTGNISIICGQDVIGWDIGPFNHFADQLVRKYKNEACDKNAKFGKKGNVDIELLRLFFNQAAVTASGENFYLKPPPKSSDPTWYRLPQTQADFETALRTVEYLATYGFFHTLSYVPDSMPMPQAFITFGGGWKNPLTVADFQNLLDGIALVLPEHIDLFNEIRSRFKQKPILKSADLFGLSGTYMEARIFADMAYSKIINRPFTFPQSTGCKTPTVGGIFKIPNTGKKYQICDYLGQPDRWSEKWNRAAKGWS